MHRYLLTFLLASAVLLPSGVMAASAPGPDNGFSFNPVLFTLLLLIVVLVFANAMLAMVLKQLAVACWNKSKEPGKGSAIKTLALLALFLLPAAHAFAQEADEVAAPVSPYISGIPRTDFYFMTGLIGFLLLTLLILILLVRMLARELRGAPARSFLPRLVLRKNFLDRFNKSVAVAAEENILLDHDYDGIRELDNDLPPWWKYGFVLTVITAALYLGYYHIGGGPGQAEELRVAMAKAEEEKAEYLAKAANNVDEHTVVMIQDEAALAGAKEIFQSTCAACHAKDGGGNVGPNLTDIYWLHGGSIQDVFKSIKYGWPDKGMKSWKDDYSPRQIAALASYVRSLKGSSPAAPKAPQGTAYTDADSTAANNAAPAPGPVASAAPSK